MRFAQTEFYPAWLKPYTAMLPTLVFSIVVCTLLFGGSVHAVDPVREPSLDMILETAPTALDRSKKLGNASATWIFDYTSQSTYSFEPGSVVNANAATFPASISNELTLALIQLGPCAMLPPHYHPRGSNYVVATRGNTTTYMVLENGAPLVTVPLTPGKMTIFPRGSLHAMVNTGCGNNQLVSALSTTDTGTHNILNGLFQMPENIVDAAFGNPQGGARSWGKDIPPVAFGAVKGDPDCLARCRSVAGSH